MTPVPFLSGQQGCPVWGPGAAGGTSHQVARQLHAAVAVSVDRPRGRPLPTSSEHCPVLMLGPGGARGPPGSDLHLRPPSPPPSPPPSAAISCNFSVFPSTFSDGDTCQGGSCGCCPAASCPMCLPWPPAPLPEPRQEAPSTSRGLPATPRLTLSPQGPATEPAPPLGCSGPSTSWFPADPQPACRALLPVKVSAGGCSPCHTLRSLETQHQSLDSSEPYSLML